MSGDGTVAEGDLVEALTLLADRAGERRPERAGRRLDRRRFALARLLPRVRHRRAVRLGAAGRARAARRMGRRDRGRRPATTRPTGRCIPAAFAPWSGGAGRWKRRAGHQRRRAATRTTSVAMFSNAGKWIMCHRPGAALMSCYPAINGSRAVVLQAVGAGRQGWRETHRPGRLHQRLRGLERHVVRRRRCSPARWPRTLFANGTDRCRAGQGGRRRCGDAVSTPACASRCTPMIGAESGQETLSATGGRAVPQLPRGRRAGDGRAGRAC